MSDVLQSLQGAVQDLVTQGLSPNDPNFPKFGVISYNGRVGFELDAWEDELNRKFVEATPVCASSDVGSNVYPGNKDLWLRYRQNGQDSFLPESAMLSDLPQGSSLYSLCQYLHPVNGHVPGDDISSSGMLRLRNFVEFTGKMPRGSTDLSYYLRIAPHENLLGSSATAANHLIAITDGLPNIPKRIPASVCRSSPYLKSEPIQITSGGIEYCVDRQFRLAANKAHDAISNDVNFKRINVHNILYTGSNYTFSDTDAQGTLSPTDFLAENSARSGNGKVKFKVARTASELRTYMLERLIPQISRNTIHYVEIQVNDRDPYMAVSELKFAEFFSLKFIGLRAGLNSVKVTVAYGDEKITQNYQVNVNEALTVATDKDYVCRSSSITAPIDDDGIFPDGSRRYPISDADDGRDGIEVINLNPIATERSLLKSGGLALQGGVGNCGTISGGLSGYINWSAWFLVLSPLLVAFVKSAFRRKK